MSNLIRLSPFRSANSLQSEVDSLFGRFSGHGEDMPSSVWSPSVDLVEREDAYVIHMDLPGLSHDDVSITYEAGKLQISGDRTFDNDADTKPQFHRVERWYGRFFRSFDLGREVDPTNIQATFNNGVLEIELPKKEESKPMTIKIS